MQITVEHACQSCYFVFRAADTMDPWDALTLDQRFADPESDEYCIPKKNTRFKRV